MAAAPTDPLASCRPPPAQGQLPAELRRRAVVGSSVPPEAGGVTARPALMAQ
jgi:hypothetical protein